MLILFSCGVDGGDAIGPVQSGEKQAGLEEIEKMFPLDVANPIDVVFSCYRADRRWVYDYDFMIGGELQIRYETDTGSQEFIMTTYEFSNNQVKIFPVANFSPYIELSNEMRIPMGMVVYFTAYFNEPGFSASSPHLECIAVGHRYNPNRAAEYYRSYKCPDVSSPIGPWQENVFEFAPLGASVWNIRLTGSIFRHREDTGFSTPTINRKYGIYRRVGDKYCGYFYNQYNDFNVVTGQFSPNDAQITVDQLEGGPCIPN